MTSESWYLNRVLLSSEKVYKSAELSLKGGGGPDGSLTPSGILVFRKEDRKRNRQSNTIISAPSHLKTATVFPHIIAAATILF